MFVATLVRSGEGRGLDMVVDVVICTRLDLTTLYQEGGRGDT